MTRALNIQHWHEGKGQNMDVIQKKGKGKSFTPQENKQKTEMSSYECAKWGGRAGQLGKDPPKKEEEEEGEEKEWSLNALSGN